ncbi:MAG: thiamine ABC transporter substrate-binding protein, partial [Anaerolineales bacterium]|nr:thiamine ABC transporter substrate-binding protein [Anaerolineales bacterium]MBP6211204.1 thiamine ABC transporter substrate-binding protein [Anaerolineales bacterium]
MKRITFYFLLLTLLLASCAPTPAPTSAGPQTITVLTHDSFAISEDVVKAFEADNNAKVSFIQSGDAGSMLNQSILTKDAPIADVIFGVDNTFLSRALEADIFEAYQSPELTNIADEFKLDPSNRALPVDYGDVCINYDKAYFTENNLAVPQSFEDLAKTEYKGLLVVEDPATSSPGLAFLLAT